MADMGLGAILGLAGAGLSASASGESAMIQLMNLRFQQQQAANQMRLATAGRTDAYGDQMVYDPGSNSWKIILSPTQQEVTNASQSEQLAQLHDQTTNRTIREEARGRAQQLLPDYQKALAGFRYDEAPSQAADADKLNTLMSLQNQSAQRGDAQAVGRTLIRQGRGADFPIVLKAADDALGQGVAPNLLKSYQASIPQHQQDVQFRQSKYLPVLQQLSQDLTAGGTGNGTPFNAVPAQLMQTQGQQTSQLAQALQNTSSNMNTAYNNLAKAYGDTAPNMKDIASLITAFKGKNNNGTQYGLVPDGTADPTAGFATSGDTNSGVSDWFNGFGT